MDSLSGNSSSGKPAAPGTIRMDDADIPSGFPSPGTGPTGQLGGPTLGPGYGGGPSGTIHFNDPEIPSGFGTASGAVGPHVRKGDLLAINGVSYAYDQLISKFSGEAEVHLLEKDGARCVFKLYYQTYKAKDEVLGQLKQLHHEDIINVIDYGYFHDRFFEIMEYAEGGSLEETLPIRDPARLRAIVAETVNAFKFCHSRGIVHKDIKPSNLFYKKADSTDLVIGDFGISSALDNGMSRRLTSQALTVGYAAPEMYGAGGKVYVGCEVDYYALGITMIHIWLARSPFENLTIHAIANLTTNGAITVPDDMPTELQTLVRGLITIEYHKRWGYGEVQRWLNGESVPVYFKTYNPSYPPFRFDVGEEASSPLELVARMKARPDRGKRLLYSGKVSAWVNLFDPALAATLDRISEDEYPKDQDAGLQKAIFLCNPDEPFVHDKQSCRSAQDLAAILDDGFAAYETELAKSNHSFYLYLEAHDGQKEADVFRSYFTTFSGKKALNTVIIELRGRQSIAALGQTFHTADEVLRAEDGASLVKLLIDPESRLSLWFEGAASLELNARLDQWRGLKIHDAATLSFVSSHGDGVPKLELSKNALTFTDLKSRSTTAGSFEIRNRGGGSLSGSVISTKSWLRLGQNTIDPHLKTQAIGFTIDTTGLAFGAAETGAIEVQSNIGAEAVSVSINVEQGIQAAARFRRALCVGAGVLGAGIGWLVSGGSAWLGASDPSGLAALAAVVAVAVESRPIWKKTGHPPVLGGLLASGLALLVFVFLFFWSPPTCSIMAWALLLVTAAFPLAPFILRKSQTTLHRKPALPVGVATAVLLLVGLVVTADRSAAAWLSDKTGITLGGGGTAGAPTILGLAAAAEARREATLASEQEAARRAEVARLLEVGRKLELQRQEEQAERQAEAQRQAELQRQAEEAQEAQQAEAQRQAQLAEEQRHQQERRAAAQQVYQHELQEIEQERAAANSNAQGVYQQRMAEAARTLQQEQYDAQMAAQHQRTPTMPPQFASMPARHQGGRIVMQFTPPPTMANGGANLNNTLAAAQARYQQAVQAAQADLNAANRQAQQRVEEARARLAEASQ